MSKITIDNYIPTWCGEGKNLRCSNITSQPEITCFWHWSCCSILSFHLKVGLEPATMSMATFSSIELVEVKSIWNCKKIFSLRNEKSNQHSKGFFAKKMKGVVLCVYVYKIVQKVTGTKTDLSALRFWSVCKCLSKVNQLWALLSEPATLQRGRKFAHNSKSGQTLKDGNISIFLKRSNWL